MTGEAAAPAASAPRGLRRELGTWDATAVVVGSIIGSGIFYVPNRIAAEFPDAGVMLGLWLFGGLISLAGALTVAELAAMYPRSGGPYHYVRETFGPVPGFIAGWSYFLLGRAAIGAAVLLVFADHAAYFVGLSELGRQLLATWGVVSLTFINWMGLKQGKRVQNVFTALKTLALLMLVVVVLALVAPAAPGTAVPPPAGGNLSLALVLILFAYNAWINTTFISEEVKSPERSLPRALTLGTLGVMGLYLLANATYLFALGPAGVAGSDLVATEAMGLAVGEGGAAFVAAAVLVSIYGNANGGVLTGSRLPMAMAQRGELPAPLAELNDRGVPGKALWLQCAAMSAFILTGTFQAAATYSVLAIWGILALVGIAVVVQRRRRPDAPRPYKVPLYPLVPAVFVAGALLVVGTALLQQPAQALIVALLMLSGLPFYAWEKRKAKRRSATGVAQPTPPSEPHEASEAVDASTP